MTNLLVIDIETVPCDEPAKALLPFLDSVKGDARKNAFAQAEDAENKRAVAINKAALSPVASRLASIGIKEVHLFGSPNQEQQNACIIDIDEKKMLTDFAGVVNKSVGWWFITFNGRNFDFPYLMFRAAIHDIPLTLPIAPYNGRDSHIDMFQHLNQVSNLEMLYAYWKMIGLGKWQDYFGLGKKQDIARDGTLARYFKEGNYDEIKKYNLEDVDATFWLFAKFSGNFDLSPHSSRTFSGV